MRNLPLLAGAIFLPKDLKDNLLWFSKSVILFTRCSYFQSSNTFCFLYSSPICVSVLINWATFSGILGNQKYFRCGKAFTMSSTWLHLVWGTCYTYQISEWHRWNVICMDSICHIIYNTDTIYGVHYFLLSITFYSDQMRSCWRHGENLSVLKYFLFMRTSENLVQLLNTTKWNDKFAFTYRPIAVLSFYTNTPQVSTTE